MYFDLFGVIATLFLVKCYIGYVRPSALELVILAKYIQVHLPFLCGSYDLCNTLLELNL